MGYPQLALEPGRTYLQGFDELPKEQQELQIRRWEWFQQQQPSEKQPEARALWTSLRDLPSSRQAAVGQALPLLQMAPAGPQQNLLNQPAFRHRFSPGEHEIVLGLMNFLVPPF